MRCDWANETGTERSVIIISELWRRETIMSYREGRDFERRDRHTANKTEAGKITNGVETGEESEVGEIELLWQADERQRHICRAGRA